MLRQAGGRAGQALARLATAGSSRNASTAAGNGNSIASLISSINSSSVSGFAQGGLNSLKACITPTYAPAAGASTGFSLQYKLLLGAAAGWILYRADTQARSKDWIIDLSLDVLQAAWWISYASFLPFRSIVVSLRGLSPASATPLQALRPAIALGK